MAEKITAQGAETPKAPVGGSLGGTTTYTFKYETVKAPAIEACKLSGKMALYGNDNMLNDEIVKLAKGSPTHGTIIGSAIRFIIGDGIEVEGTAIDPKELVKNGDWYTFAQEVAQSLQLYNGFGIVAIYNQAGVITDLEPVQYGHIRKMMGDKTDDWGRKRQIVTEYKVSEKWKGTNGGNYCLTYEPYDPANLFKVNANGERESSLIQLFVWEAPKAEGFYATPKYWPAYFSIKAEWEYQKWVCNNITGGFATTNIVTMYGVDDELAANLAAQFQTTGGADGKRVIFIPLKDTPQPTRNLDVQTLNQLPTDKHTKSVGDARSFIISAHGLSSPMLAGLEGSGNLSGNASELESSYTLYHHNQIGTDQLNIVNALTYVLQNAGHPNATVKIKDSNPYTKTKETVNPEDNAESQ